MRTFKTGILAGALMLSVATLAAAETVRTVRVQDHAPVQLAILALSVPLNSETQRVDEGRYELDGVVVEVADRWFIITFAPSAPCHVEYVYLPLYWEAGTIVRTPTGCPPV